MTQSLTKKQAYTIRGLAETVGTTDQERTALAMVADALLDYARQTAKIRSEITNLRDRLDRAERSLDSGYHVNSLGEVQGSGLDLDRACALRSAAAEQVSMTRYYAEKLGATPEHVEALLAGTEFAKDAR